MYYTTQKETIDKVGLKVGQKIYWFYKFLFLILVNPSPYTVHTSLFGMDIWIQHSWLNTVILTSKPALSIISDFVLCSQMKTIGLSVILIIFLKNGMTGKILLLKSTLNTGQHYNSIARELLHISIWCLRTRYCLVFCSMFLFLFLGW